MKKITKILLPFASVLGLTATIAPMTACNTTTATTAVAKTTVAKTNSDVKFKAMPTTIRALEDSDHFPTVIDYIETKPFEQGKHYGWDEPVFNDKNELLFRNSARNNNTRLISETVRIDITVPANTTKTHEISIDEYVTTACNGNAFAQTVDVCSEVFQLKDETDHSNFFMNDVSGKGANTLEQQSILEQDRRVGGQKGYNHFCAYNGLPWVREWHANHEWKDLKISYTDTNTSNEPAVFSHYLNVTANTFASRASTPSKRECGYRFAFSAQEI